MCTLRFSFVLQACAHTSRVLVWLADTITCTLQATSLFGTTFSPCTTGHHCACSRATRRTSASSTASRPRARRATSCRGQTHQSGSPPTSRRHTRPQLTTELTCTLASAHAHAQMFVYFCGLLSLYSTCTSFSLFPECSSCSLTVGVWDQSTTSCVVITFIKITLAWPPVRCNGHSLHPMQGTENDNDK
jgi:hypothetical protein